ncbi:MAG: hypothetical protein A2X19_05190 [Bacteroidetes bacterium GWE2_39_28]|nr:MAG: hypothetical protein A2X19_05190 [Bacteroidetes bacterium GWE2_39_28]OFY15252.1 MAG: hypothetical protein A2X16_08910 [Bacteroidetes bacterium GWF2_39_10]OFZ11103.1 MAG: hypothetical protein A2465_02145 [Bacteroidetes bacterium RIFOXYC2_FULL_39_11]HCT93883.1 SAM-dependent methyltransferase [Rikenellaceae bacterium]
MLTQQLKEFISAHFNEDTGTIILSASKYPHIDVKLAAIIIEARKKLITKVPEWAENANLIYTGSLSTEQCSSSKTAIYKQNYCKNGIVADLTGGMGIDSYFFSKVNKKVIYIEKNRDLFNATVNNFQELGAINIVSLNQEFNITNGDNLIRDVLNIHGINKLDLIYLDPSRRKSGGKRVHSINEYEPKIKEIKEILFKYSDKILVKISPMVDIKSVKQEVNEIKSVQIIAVNNECKELLILLEKGSNLDFDKIEIGAVNLKDKNSDEPVIFTPEIENETKSTFGMPLNGNYLYEPNAAILKAGAFKYITFKYDVQKLEVNTHLYTSDKMIDNFPGRRFKIKEVADFDKITIRNLRKTYPKANISIRNFPLSATELRDRLKIEDGGGITIFGCTLSKGVKKLVTCISAN